MRQVASTRCRSSAPRCAGPGSPTWSQHVTPGGSLVIHDVFENPADGGQAPYEEIYLPAITSGRFVEVSRTGSLRVLRRVSGA